MARGGWWKRRKVQSFIRAVQILLLSKLWGPGPPRLDICINHKIFTRARLHPLKSRTSEDTKLIKFYSLRFWYPISNGGGPTENREQQREPHSDRETERLYRGHWIGAGEVTIQLLGHLVPWSMSGCSQCSLLAVTITRYTLAYCITQNILVQEVFRTPWW